MGASAWTFFNEFRIDLGEGIHDLAAGTYSLHLFTSAASANINNDALSTLGSVLSGATEVASGNGYTNSGKTLSVTYAQGDSVGQARWDFSDVVFTATGGTISNIRYALIVENSLSGGNSANLVVCRAALTTTQSPLGIGSTLTVGTPAGDGVFELAGG